MGKYRASKGSIQQKQHVFAQNPGTPKPRSTFNRSHDVLTNMSFGFLIPVFVDWALPGDTMKMNATYFGRIPATVAVPFTPMHLDCWFFSVPYRILWDNYHKWMGAQDDPGDPTDTYVIPKITTPVGGFAAKSMWDHMGIPPGIDDFTIQALPARAYMTIYNEWFRDQNLIDSATVPTDDGPDLDTLYPLKKRCRNHDYFGSALPWPQKGDAVTLPLGTDAPVTISSNTLQPIMTEGGLNARALVSDTIFDGVSPATAWTTGNVALAWGTETGLQGSVDLLNATAATINQLREAFSIQRLFEKDARGGTRVNEVLKAHFGVAPPDYRVQRPEILALSTAEINLTPVAQTSETAATAQAKLSSYGVVAKSGVGFTHSFTEHCVVIGLVAGRADRIYQSGVERNWFDSTRWDHYWPELANLGEQEILNRELHLVGDASGANTDGDIFGYIPRWDHLRYKPSRVDSNMRSSHGSTMEWNHLAEDYAATPTLDQAWIELNHDIDRIKSVPAEEDLILNAYFQYAHTRCMPTHSTPGMVRL